MHLDKIEIHGFKSFGDLVKLQIPKGITTVIGPNGSGKSNVADAIRWVLGEQSAKTLRGTKMEDIIFAGTEKRKSLGYAEVALYIQNPDRKLLIDYSEVVVKRRVYRSGESEYFLNGSPCRLKDIQELFMDTGIGKEGYSIIGQGQIDKVLSSKPEERRSLFEEAAGVYKYKVRRVEAERKLEKEKENLLRVKDILLEIESRLGPLEIEAQKTKEYLSLKDSLKDMDINIFIQEIEKMQGDISKVDEDLRGIEENIREQVVSRDTLTKAYATWKQNNQAIFEHIEQAIQHIADLEKKQQQEQGQIEINKERLVSIDTLLNQIDQDTKKQETISQNMQVEYQMLGSKKIALELEQTTQKNILNKFELQFEEVENKLKQIESSLENSKTTLYEKIHQIDIYKTEIDKHEALETQADYRHSRVTETIERLNSDIQHQEVALQVLYKKQKEKQEQLTQLEVSFALEDTRKGMLEKEKQDRRKGLDTLVQNIAQMKRQMNWLEQIKNDYEGYYKSVKQVLTLKKTEPEATSGIVGVVADLLEVPKNYELAIVTALGSSMQNIVTNTEEDAKKMIGIMKKRGIQRVTFLPQDTVKAYAPPADSPNFKKELGYLGLASEIIQYDSTYANIVGFLLGRILIVDTIEHASAIARKYGHKYKIVTLDGDVFNAGGSLTGGSNKGSTNNIFSRSRELKELKESYEQAIEAQDKQNKAFVSLEQDLDNCVKKWDSIRKEIIMVQDAQKDIALEVNKQTSTLAITKKSQIELVEEKNKIEEDKEKIKSDQRIIEDKIIQLEETVESSKHNVGDLEKELSQIKEKREQAVDEFTQKKIALSKTTQNIEHIIEQMTALENTLKNTLEQKEGILTRKDTLLEDREKIEKLNNRLQEEIEKLEKTIVEALSNKRKLENDREILGAQEVEIQEKLEKVMEVLENLKQEQFRLNNKKEILELEYKKINDAIWEQYELTYNGCLRYKKELGSLNDIKKEADRVRARIRSIGSVNVNAIADYDETQRRFTFLNDQKTDIEKAETSLLELIERLTEEMKVIFKEQFACIAENFSQVFRELFGGGMAFLQLTDEENILESGIEIIAKPPGKKLQNMTLLSGGERTLTAIALVFGILKLKPSPFCVLDEIEAALDDANVLRFADYLSSLSKETQFIVITHRKGTMERADTLYGVTMQERGVSTVLSIKLEEATEYLDQKSS